MLRLLQQPRFAPPTIALAIRSAIALVFGMAAGCAFGAEYYVAPSGSDANPGTEALPWRTIQHAADTVAAGDTVLVREGIYRERVRFQGASGSPTSPIIFKNYPGETPTISAADPLDETIFTLVPNTTRVYEAAFDWSGVASRAIYETASSIPRVYRTRGDFWSPENLETMPGVFWYDENAEKLYLHTSDGSAPDDAAHGLEYLARSSIGLSMSSKTNIVIEGFRIAFFPSANLQIDFTTDVTIRRNTFIGNDNFSQGSKGAAESAGVIIVGGSGAIVENNQIYNCRTGVTVRQGAVSATIRHNTIFNSNGSYAVGVLQASSGVSVAGNIISQVGGGALLWVDFTSTEGTTSDYNSWDIGSGFMHWGWSDYFEWQIEQYQAASAQDTRSVFLTEYPFVDPEALDFHLEADSAAISATSTTTTGTDLEGGGRPSPAGSTWDLGSFEQAGSDRVEIGTSVSLDPLKQLYYRDELEVAARTYRWSGSSDINLQLALEDASGSIIETKPHVVAPSGVERDVFDISNLTPGERYVVTARLTDSTYSELHSTASPAFTYWRDKSTEGADFVDVTPYNIVSKRGRPRFLIGWVDTLVPVSGNTFETAMDYIQGLAEEGMTIFHSYGLDQAGLPVYDNSPEMLDSVDTVLQASAESGISVMMGIQPSVFLYDDAGDTNVDDRSYNITFKIDRFKNHDYGAYEPSLTLWYLADEPSVNGISQSTLGFVNNLIKDSLDKKHPTITAPPGVLAGDYAEHDHVADALQTWVYTNNNSTVRRMMQNARNVTFGKQVVLPGILPYDGDLMPYDGAWTPVDAKAQIYTVLIGGGSGVMFWSRKEYDDDAWMTPDDRRLFDPLFADVAAETAYLSPILDTPATTGDVSLSPASSLDLLMHDYDGRRYLIALNLVDTFEMSTATGGTSNSLTDSSRNWSQINHAGRLVRILAGTGAGQIETIASNTATVLTISGTFNPAPDETSDYEIIDREPARDATFTIAGAGDGWYARTVLRDAPEYFAIDAEGRFTDSFTKNEVSVYEITRYLDPLDFSYYQRLTVGAGSDALPAGYQVATDIDTDVLVFDGKVRSDRRDWVFAFFDGSGYAEIPRAALASNETWFRTQADLSSGAIDDRYYVFYSDADRTGAPMAANEDVFVFYDGFDGDALDSFKWAGYVRNTSVAGGVMTLTGTPGARRTITGKATVSTPYGYISETRARSVGLDGEMLGGFYSSRLADEASLSARADQANFGGTNSDGESTHRVDTAIAHDTEWHLFGSALLENGAASYYIDGRWQADNASFPPNDVVHPAFGSEGGGSLEADWIRVRRFVADEPQITASGEVVCGRPGAVTGLVIASDRETISWAKVPEAAAYDIVKGDLDALLASGGDFASSLSACLENDGTDEQAGDPSNPDSGQGFFYLVRALNEVCGRQPGSYDSGAASQAGSRDSGISTSPNRCPD